MRGSSPHSAAFPHIFPGRAMACKKFQESGYKQTGHQRMLKKSEALLQSCMKAQQSKSRGHQRSIPTFILGVLKLKYQLDYSSSPKAILKGIETD